MFTVNSLYPLTSQNKSVRSEISYPTPPATRPPTPVGPAETSVTPRQSEDFLGTRDYLLSSHRPTLYHDHTSAHDIYTSKTIYKTHICYTMACYLTVPPYHNLYHREGGDGLYNCVHFLVAYFTHVLPFHIISGVLFSAWMYW